jgi:hypothetical protein
MNNLISGAIASIASVVKFFRLKQVLVVVFAGFLLFTSTACAGSSVASEPGTYNRGTSPYDKNTGPQRELYAPTQKPEGGMNVYNDDPKYDRESTKAKTEKVIQKSTQHLENRAANPKEAIDNLGDRDIPDELRGLSKNIGNRAERMKDEVSAGTQRGMRNLKQNLEDAKDAVPEVVNEAVN